MGKKKDKSKKGKGAEKTALKTEKNAERKMKKILKSKGEENIEALIAECQEQCKTQTHVIEEKCEEPSPRSNATWTPHPNKDELILFGGEYFNGKKTLMHNELFMYSIKHNTWTLLKAPGSPPPRSSHQAVTVKQGGGQLWIFGGEFASPSQSQFFHYRDLWVFYFHSNKWEKISVPGGPSARSGHRMVVSKRQIIVFGGFHDSHKGNYTYFNDVHAFDLDTYTWSRLTADGTPPLPRSGGCVTVTQDEKSIVIYGGYSKTPVKKDVDRGTMHTDLFLLTKGDNNTWSWSQVKQSGSRPSPRCGCAVVATPGNRALFFGGVVDDEEDDDIDSKFFSNMYTLELDKGKWYEVTLRNKKGQKEKKKRRRKKDDKTVASVTTAASDDDDDMCASDDDEVIGDIDVDRLAVSSLITDDNKSNAFTSESSSSSKDAENAFWPCARMNAQLAVHSGVLYLYGGMYEEGDKQMTLQDLYALDLHKLDQWKTLIKNEADKLVWEESEGSDSDDSDDDDDDSDDDDDDDDEDTGMDTDEPPALSKDEKLNDYFSRTKDVWLDKAEELAEKEEVKVNMKQLKKAALKMATEYHQERSSKQ